MAESFHLRALRIAARQLGGTRQLGSYLGVPTVDLYRWLSGEQPTPQAVIVRVIEFLAARETAANSAPYVPDTQRARAKRNLV